MMSCAGRGRVKMEQDKKTVVERIKRDLRFAKALYAGAVNVIPAK